MTAFPIDRESFWDSEPRWRWRFWPTRAFSYSQIADLIKLDGFATRIGNRQCITGYGITCLELMLGLSTGSDTDEKLSHFSSNNALNSQRITQIDMAHLVERAVQSNPRLDRNQYTVPRDFLSAIASRKVQAAFLSNLYS